MLAARLVATFYLEWPTPRWLLAPLAALALSACGGSGGDSDSPPPTGDTVTISGKITFERVPFKATVGTGLNFLATVDLPARGIVVEALNGSTDAVLAFTSTNATGDYSMQVAANQSVRIRAKAQMLTIAAPIMNFRVLNNVNSNALYVLDGSVTSSGTADSTRNLRAPSGWTGAGYTATRAAAPFAILDTVYKAKELVLSASPGATLPDLSLFWSDENKTDGGCTSTGAIGTSFYTPVSPDPTSCTTAGLAGIYILGFFAGGSGDTDEFDEHVIAHEFGHYIEDQFGRSDSIGGEHGGGDRLDLRLAFGEGWGNAYSGMTLNDPQYRDSSGTTSDGGLNMETGSTVAEGWYSEASVGEILWDLFDEIADGENVQLGFTPIFAVMTGAQTTTDALTSIFSFATALRSANPESSAAIGNLLTGESISGTDAFGAGESNDAGNQRVLLNGLYKSITRDTQMPVCAINQFGSAPDDARKPGNKLGNRVLLRFENDTDRTLVIRLIGAPDPTDPGTVAAIDPDVMVWRQGALLDVLGDDEIGTTETTQSRSFAPGTYVIDVFDYEFEGTNTAPHCMTVSITGN